MESLVEKQIDAAQTLHSLLLKENEALSQRDTEMIQAISIEKQQQTHALETLIQKQYTLLNSQNTHSTAQNNLPEGQAQLQKVLSHCKQQNSKNGALIAASRQSVETAIAILKGQDNPTSTSYSPSGKSVIEPCSSRCLAKT